MEHVWVSYVLIGVVAIIGIFVVVNQVMKRRR